ncbi:proline dehydrogenase family protein [Paenibacillus sacheonensis]|uniref:proline dehydrogenase n=1 Tax=Paenibacillus sacheonensis TaxID=742054 RepID=A0A7X4YMP4_9BACL|nr:proline dehydrogenase family protein [Paenibacillus sacheonensis]MBM7563237.1 proline dehydrogenase [Paenibacillus sacheonensis]NBC68204.1 proline dehydrogenase [Paenibacillus sacheonensis]
MELLLKGVFQALGKSTFAHRMAKKYGLRLGAARFVAGETIRQSIDAVGRLNADGRMATLDHLGEFVTSGEEAERSADMCLQTLDAIAESGVLSNLSLKLSSLGLDIDRELCARNMKRILDRAREHGNFVRIDMEDSAHCQPALDIYRSLRREYDNVGIVLQAYLFRTEEDVKEMHALKANLRLVKGAYKEPPGIAFASKKDVDDNLKRIICLHLLNGNYTAVASHDEAIIDYTKRLVSEEGISREAFEFQMLYGICEDLQKRLVREGYRVRIYVPFGIDWFGYFMRRLAERPANVWFVLRNLLN